MNRARCATLLASAALVCALGAEARSLGHGSAGHGGIGRGRAGSGLGRSGRGRVDPAFAGVSFGQFTLHVASAQGYGRPMFGYGRPEQDHAGVRFAQGYGHGGGGYSRGGNIQCVTFARADSGIELSGNANTWWSHAEGVYQRGAVPEPGSVLNFRANGAMRMGHVAVVQQVVDGRTVIIDHANWGGPGAGRGRVSRDVSVVDVSPRNDWSAVRVALGHTGEYGSIYPTYGFIYNRPDGGTMVAGNARAAAMPDLNPAPRDLRPDPGYDEVAEAPEGMGSSYRGYARHASYHHHHIMVVTSHRHRRHGS